MMAPAKTPRDIVNRLQAEVQKALASDDVKERFTKLGAEAFVLQPEQFDRYIKDEIEVNAKVVKAAGITPQ
jgi:tripartite-type tricarboxylate transporter receptor subunit TctC